MILLIFLPDSVGAVRGGVDINDDLLDDDEDDQEYMDEIRNSRRDSINHGRGAPGYNEVQADRRR